MAQVIPLLILAFAVSLDSFSVGFTYGLRNMRIPFRSLVIIACCSATMIMLAIALGRLLEQFFSSSLAEAFGGVILVFLGIWVLYRFFRPEKPAEFHETMLVNLEIKSLGLVINILRKPTSADFDRSGTITGVEALMLGLALSLDAFGAGVGAALIGAGKLYFAAAVAILSSLLVLLGIRSGSIFSNYLWMQKFSFIPGILLIIIGIWKM